MDAAAEIHDEWQGMPVPVPGLKLRLQNRHPHARMVAHAEDILEQRGPLLFECAIDETDQGEVVVNKWFSYSRHAWVYLMLNPATGRRRAIVDRVSVDQSMGRLTHALMTI